MRRRARFALLLAVSWCAMTVTHECGHVAAGWASGGTLAEAEIAPWGLPRSRFEPDPLPLVTLWGGPLLGVAAPLLFALAARRAWAWFVADFCLLANGCYLTLAWLTGDPNLDAARLLRHGARPEAVAAYCAATVGAGYPRFRGRCREALA